MLAAARKYQRVVQVALWQRSNLHFQQAAQIVRAGPPRQGDVRPHLELRQRLPGRHRQPARLRAARRARLGHVARPGAEGALQREPLRRGPTAGPPSATSGTTRTACSATGPSTSSTSCSGPSRRPGPQVITAAGQKHAVKDNGDTPDTLQTTFEYPGFVCTYENRQANGNSMFGKGYGIEFHGTEATMFLNRSGFEVFPETRRREGRRGEGDGGRARGVDAHGRGRRRALQPRGQHARVHEEPEAPRLRHRGRAALVGHVPARESSRSARRSGSSSTRSSWSSVTASPAPRGSSSAASTARPGS